MIPADVASRLQVSADAAQRPVAPAQEIADKLPGLVAGQKVMAEIQSLLPNGTYRALINQRSITLALPFSAKSGDALELQVTEANGKLALAVVARPGGENAQTTPGAAATLSRTGQLIATLFAGTRQAQGGSGNAPALPLSGNQPLGASPLNAQNLLPVLRQSIAQSGMFYEAHQAEWVAGRLPQAALLQEPQGKLSSPAAFAQAAAQNAGQPESAARPLAAATPGQAGPTARAPADTTQALAATADAGKAAAAQPGSQATQAVAQLIAPQTHAVVQQQLEALATQNFAWQGQVWPGQEMRWEIDEDARRHGQTGEQDAAPWTTRLQLTLPNLGEVSAQIRLDGNRITLAMSADNAETRTLLRSSSAVLRGQLDAAGLTLASIGIGAAPESNNDGQSGA